MVIDTRSLPQEIKDIIEIREGTDPTFSRFVDFDYTEIFWDKLAERADPNTEHSMLISMYGLQGGGKCFKKEMRISSGNGVVSAKDLKIGDRVFDENGMEQTVKNIWYSKKNCINVGVDFASDAVVSDDHRLMTKRGLICAKDLVIGDMILMSRRSVEGKGGEKEYRRAFVFGAFAADGNAVVGRQKWANAKRKSGMRRDGTSSVVMISNNDRGFLDIVAEMMRKEFRFVNVVVREASGHGRFVITATGRDAVRDFAGVCGSRSENKVVPVEVLRTKEGIRGFLDGYCNGDLTCNVVKSKEGKYRTEVGWLVKSETLAMGMLDALHCEGFWPIVNARVLRSGRWVGNTYVRMSLPAKSVIEFFGSRNFVSRQKMARVNEVQRLRMERVVGAAYNTIHGNTIITNDKSIVMDGGKYFTRVHSLKMEKDVECMDIEVSGDSHLFQFAGGLVSHNSFSGIAMCSFLDPNFSVDNIFFGYDQLVYARQRLKTNSAVLVDEQSQVYGLDSHRVNIILSSLKEQLRKKSIHFIFCSPVLYPESQSSMYIVECIFIDYETKEVYAALKTREGLTLGHVRIPHPLKVLEDGSTLSSKELVDAYQKKKDAHLERVLGQKNVDQYEERAEHIVRSPLFKKAEKLYVRQMGYIPNAAVVQLINKLMPEFNAGVVPLEIAGRIKINKELSGEWAVAGRVSRRDRGGKGKF